MIHSVTRTASTVATTNDSFAMVLNSLGEAIVATDLSGTVTVFNSAAETVFGLQAPDVLNKSIHSILSNSSSLSIRRFAERVLKASGSLKKNFKVATKGGYRANICATLSAIRAADGEVTGFAAVISKLSTVRIAGSPRSQEAAARGVQFGDSGKKVALTEDRYRYLFLNNPVPMWIFDAKTLRFLIVNEAAINQYGYSMDEFSRISVLDIRRPELCEKFLSAIKDFGRVKQRKSGEWEHRTKDGHVRYVDIVCNAIDFEGTDAILVLAKDITEQKIARELLVKSNEENERILESIGDGFMSVDRQYNITFWNKSAEKIVGVPRQELIGKNLWQVFKGASSLRFFPEYERAWADQTKVVFEECYAALSLWIEVTAYPSENSLSIFFRDVTVKKLAIDKIKQANDQFNMVARITNDAIYEWDSHTNEIVWGEGYTNLFGHARTAAGMPVESWSDNIHPNEKAGLLYTIHEAFVAKLPSLKRELRFRCADGSYKLVYDKMVIVYDEEGKPLRIMGAMQDITEMRIMERKILNAKSSQQRAITRATIQGQEKEREQIGIELHDNINQILATSALYMEHALSMPDLNRDILNQSKDLVQLAAKEIRKLSHTLLPPSIGEFELVPALNELANSFNLARKFLVDVHLRTFNEIGIPREQKLTIYRIAQEQLNNIQKHAECTEVLISLKRKYNPSEACELIISDNGKGFNANQKRSGVGLRNIVSRAELFCGKAEIISSPGEGCTIIVRIPVPNGIGDEAETAC